MSNFNIEASPEVQFIDIFDLSIIEMATLSHLITLSKKILRYDLYKEINGLLSPHKKLSTSSFYNSLQKLEKKKYIKFEKIDNKDPKSLAVHKTALTEKVLGYMFYYFTQYQIKSPKVKAAKSLTIIQQLCKRNSFNNVMIIDPETQGSTKLIASIIPSAVETVKAIGKISRSVYLLSTRELYDYYLNQSVDKVISGGEEGSVDKFDLIIFPLYNRNFEYNSIDHKEILIEIKRLLSADGSLIILHLEKLDDGGNYIIKHFIDSLSKSGYFDPIDGDYFKYQLEKLKFKEVRKQLQDGVNYIVAKSGNN